MCPVIASAPRAHGPASWDFCACIARARTTPHFGRSNTSRCQLSPLGTEISDTHLIVRIQLDSTKLKVRHLKKEFFDGVGSDEQLQRKVEDNLNNDAMYDGPWVAGSLTNQP